MRVGVYGGSFNPPHLGHALAARELVEKLELDELLVIPAAIPPHKDLAPGSPGPEDRLALCRAAFAGIPGVTVSDLELRRAGKSYTVDTLTQLRAQRPGDEMFFVMGTDMLLSFRAWREPERIAALATLAVMRRDENEETWARVRAEAEYWRQTVGAGIVLTENRCIPISSTTVRRLLALGAPAQLDPAVEARILERGWYLTGGALRDLPFETLRPLALSLHDEKRRPHVEGTWQTARALAERWGADPDLAARAGVLHDVTKALGPKEQLHLAEKYAMMLTEHQRSNPKLLHAKTGAEAARRVFGECPAVVDAIWWHTTGRPEMTPLEKILYIADYMEPNRAFPGVEILRDLVWKDLDAAVYRGLDQSLTLLRRQGRIIDPDSQAAWEFYDTTTERSDPQ